MATIETVLIDFQARVDNALRNTERLAESIEKIETRSEKAENAADKLIKLFTNVGKVFAVAKVADYIENIASASIQAASRVSEMDRVLDNMARRNGYRTSELKNYVAQVKAMGITTQSSQRAVSDALSSGIQLDQLAKLARVSQDYAVLSQSNSSETLDRIMYGITSGNSQVLKTAGVDISPQVAYAEYAKSIGVVSTALTGLQKNQALVNAVIESGVSITGTYESAQQDAGKRQRSLARYVEETYVNIGTQLLPAYEKWVTIQELLYKGVFKLTSEGGSLNEVFSRIGESATKGLSLALDLLKSDSMINFRDAAIDLLGTLLSVYEALEPIIGILGTSLTISVLEGLTPIIEVFNSLLETVLEIPGAVELIGVAIAALQFSKLVGGAQAIATALTLGQAGAGAGAGVTTAATVGSRLNSIGSSMGYAGGAATLAGGLAVGGGLLVAGVLANDVANENQNKRDLKYSRSTGAIVGAENALASIENRLSLSETKRIAIEKLFDKEQDQVSLLADAGVQTRKQFVDYWMNLLETYDLEAVNADLKQKPTGTLRSINEKMFGWMGQYESPLGPKIASTDVEKQLVSSFGQSVLSASDSAKDTFVNSYTRRVPGGSERQEILSAQRAERARTALINQTNRFSGDSFMDLNDIGGSPNLANISTGTQMRLNQSSLRDSLAEIEGAFAYIENLKANFAAGMGINNQSIYEMLFSAPDSGVTTSSIGDEYDRLISQSVEFSGKITEAYSKGLNPTTLEQIITAGPEAGLAALDRILADDSLLELINKNEKLLYEHGLRLQLQSEILANSYASYIAGNGMPTPDDLSAATAFTSTLLNTGLFAETPGLGIETTMSLLGLEPIEVADIINLLPENIRESLQEFFDDLAIDLKLNPVVSGSLALPGSDGKTVERDNKVYF